MVNGPCEGCPYRKDVRPYLTKERGLGLALLTRNRFAVFWCHKSTGVMGGKRSLRLCKGFAELRAQEAGNRFVPADSPTYGSMGEMITAYMEHGHGT